MPISRIISRHNDLHRLIETQLEFDFYVVFKHDLFKTFDYQFPEFVLNNPNMKGCAESINSEVLDYIINREKETLLVFLYENKDITKNARKYVVFPKVFYNFAVKNVLIREQDAVNTAKKADFSGENEYIHEKTMHIPFKRCFFHNFDEWIEKNIVNRIIRVR